MDSPALGKAELVVGGCASWTFSKGGRRKLLRSKAKKKTAQRTARTPCAASLAASHVHSSRAAPAAGTPLAHTRLQGMLTGAPVLCIWGVILDLTHTQDSEQIVPEWMKERRGPRSLIPRDFQVAEADRLAYTSLLAATRALVVLLYPAPVSCSPGE